MRGKIGSPGVAVKRYYRQAAGCPMQRFSTWGFDFSESKVKVFVLSLLVSAF
jgi:hypothetical protein